MDRFSFLNAAHTAFFADLYDQYIQNPDSVEPSWKAFFQGFDFANEFSSTNLQELIQGNTNPSGNINSDKIQKEFNVLKLIEAYRTRGHLFTKTNPVRERRNYTPNLAIENYGLTAADLNTVFDAAKVVNLQPCSLNDIIKHLDTVYCQHIGVEYMYIRDPKVIEWIRQRLHQNSNQPKFSNEQKKAYPKKIK